MISEMMPKLGRMMMYTSGCPKIQKRCCHRSGSAPASGSKNCESNVRSNSKSNKATVMTGRANANRNCVTSSIQVRTGMRMRSMPGARILRQVTIKLTADTSEAMPVMSRPIA